MKLHELLYKLIALSKIASVYSKKHINENLGFYFFNAATSLDIIIQEFGLDSYKEIQDAYYNSLKTMVNEMHKNKTTTGVKILVYLKEEIRKNNTNEIVEAAFNDWMERESAKVDPNRGSEDEYKNHVKEWAKNRNTFSEFYIRFIDALSYAENYLIYLNL